MGCPERSIERSLPLIYLSHNKSTYKHICVHDRNFVAIQSKIFVTYISVQKYKDEDLHKLAL